MYVDMCACGHVCMWTCVYVDMCVCGHVYVDMCVVDMCVCGHVCVNVKNECNCTPLIRKEPVTKI